MDQGYSQVFWDACASGDFAADCAEIKKGCDINYQNGDGRAALMRAAKRDYKDIVRVLLYNGADVNQVDNKGKTAIMGAAKKGNTVSYTHLDVYKRQIHTYLLFFKLLDELVYTLF